jgi:hypothetical protein
MANALPTMKDYPVRAPAPSRARSRRSAPFDFIKSISYIQRIEL